MRGGDGLWLEDGRKGLWMARTFVRGSGGCFHQVTGQRPAGTEPGSVAGTRGQSGSQHGVRGGGARRAPCGPLVPSQVNAVGW